MSEILFHFQADFRHKFLFNLQKVNVWYRETYWSTD